MSPQVTEDGEYAVEISDLAATLRERWQALVDKSELPLHRSATLNLIAVTSPERLADLREEFQHLVLRQPCRAFFLVFTPDADSATSPPTRVTYFAGVETQPAARSVRYERLTFHCTPADTPRIESLIRPHALDDLPTILLTMGSPPCDTHTLTRLARSANLHVFDSSMLDSPSTELEALRGVTSEFRDLAWLRLSPWRRALARAFERVPWSPDTKVHGVIRHAPGRGAQASSELLRSWLNRRLGAEITLALADDAAGTGPNNEPRELSIDIGASNVLLAHCCERPRIRTQISLEGLCLVPFETPASSSCRGSLIAAAADGA